MAGAMVRRSKRPTHLSSGRSRTSAATPIGRMVVTKLGTLEIDREREVSDISQIADNMTVTGWAVSSAG